MVLAFGSEHLDETIGTHQTLRVKTGWVFAVGELRILFSMSDQVHSWFCLGMMSVDCQNMQRMNLDALSYHLAVCCLQTWGSFGNRT